MTDPQLPRRERVTLADVASAAKVDPSVVSRVINADARLVIKPDTRDRVLAAIKDLQYHPNAAARSLRTAHSGTLGLLIPDFANPIYAEIIKGAEEAATERSALLLTGTADQHRPERYVEMLASGRVDGLILGADRLPRSTVEAMIGTGRPVVSVNQRIPGVGHIILADDEHASRLAVEHLTALGHRRIAHLRGPATSDTARRRLAGYRKAMRSAGLPVDPAYVVGTDYTSEAGGQGMEQLLALRPRPTAVLIANVAAAIGALSTARRSGMRIPEDISVVAIHDIPLAANLFPALTTVRMPLHQMGRAGVSAICGPQPPAAGTSVVRQPTELIVRESTAAPGGG